MLGDAGQAASALPIDEPGPARAALYASTPASTQVVAVYRGMPDPNAGLALAIPVVVGQQHGIAQVTAGAR